MAENDEKAGKFVAKCVAAASKRALEGFDGCFERLCNELSSVNDRVGILEENDQVCAQETKALKYRVELAEQKLVTLSERLDDFELRAGAAATAKIAEATFSKIPDLEAP